LATSGVQSPRRSLAGWQKGNPEPEDLDRVWPAFKRLIPVIDDCALDTVGDAAGSVANADTKPETVLAPKAAGRAPRKLELEIPVAWVARNGDALLKVVVRRDTFEECDGPREFPSQLWLYRDARGGVRPLAGQLESMRVDLVSPLDFNDLLRDGHDEVLFWAAGYNRGGYVLYYDGFRKSVKYLWSYH
jgi:non-ribosomal peptide synthetase component F